jgi:hypothetical protein
MAYTAQPLEQIQVQVPQTRYELFKTVPMKLASGEYADVLQSIGMFSIAELNNRKDFLLAELAEIEEKINCINALNA